MIVFFTKNNTIVESDFNFIGLRESTIEFVDYDTDGDLDIFLSGLGNDGAETILYEVNINSKTNTSDQCLLKNAVNYAKNWKFNQDFSSSQRQEGWIEFIYLSQ